MSFKIIQICALISTVIGLSHSFHLVRNQPYRIQSVADNHYLSVVDDNRLCDPLSKVITDPFLGSATSWSPNWWGDQPYEWGVHMNSDRLQNELTFQDFPPNCYPGYNFYDIQQVYHGLYGMTLQNRESGLCLTNSGSGQPITFQTCDSSDRNQIWKFEEINAAN